MRKASVPVQTERAVYQLKVSVDGISPLIWRRLQISEDATLPQLHQTLQVLFGWLDYHLHEFIMDGCTFAEPDEEDALYRANVRDERGATLSTIMKRVGGVLIYHYDFGDDWYVSAMLEAIVLPEDGVRYPRCLAGERAGPPEDVGGPPGYENYREALANPYDEQHRELLPWGGPFDAQQFDIAAVNQELAARFKPRWGKQDAAAAQAAGTTPAKAASTDWPSNIVSILDGAPAGQPPGPKRHRPASRKPKTMD